MLSFISSLNATEKSTLYTRPKGNPSPPNKNDQISLRGMQKYSSHPLHSTPSSINTLKGLSQMSVAHVVRSWVFVSIIPPKVASPVIFVLIVKVRKGKQ